MDSKTQKNQNIWLEGSSQTGKTSRLITLFQQWVNQQLKKENFYSKKLHPVTPAILILAGNDDNKKVLADQLSQSVKGSYPIICKTPLGFFSDEVILFFPLIFQQLNLKAQFPLRLRPETEQDLATRLWHDQLTDQELALFGNEYRFVRCILDLLQLAAASGTPAEDISGILTQSQLIPELPTSLPIHKTPLAQKIGDLIIQWRDWCLDRGFISYGIVYELYWRYLLPNQEYQSHLFRRFQGIFADNVDDYPAIAKDLFDLLLDQGVYGVFTYNPHGQIRKGLNGDPDYLLTLAQRCKIEILTPKIGFSQELIKIILPCVREMTLINQFPESIQSIQASSRAELIKQTSDFIIDLVRNKNVNPSDIALIAPGVDEIARYSFLEIFSAHHIPLEPLNEQRALISSSLIRALLTLLCLIFPNLGRLAPKDAVAEMLVVLSQKPVTTSLALRRLEPKIDPVRAGLLADFCYYLDEYNPHLLPYQSYNRWDRLGAQVTEVYEQIFNWLERTKNLVKREQITRPLLILNQAIEDFWAGGNILPFEQLATLRELMETVQHFWEVERRLRQNEPSLQEETATIAQFIYLLRRGTMTANPRPINLVGGKKSAITLANIFQYRSLRTSHQYQFWLDTGSPFWSQGGASDLFGFQVFLKHRLGKPISIEEGEKENQARLERILRDLLVRVGKKLYLCHSDLSVTGTEQNGILLPLVNGATLVNI